MNETDILARLMTVIEQRRATMPDDSYTSQLLRGGLTGIGEKLIEEVTELVDAGQSIAAARLVDEAATATGQQAGAPDPAQRAKRQAVVHEAADLIYHLLVLLAACGTNLTDVENELAKRFGTSGLAEKAARQTS